VASLSFHRRDTLSGGLAIIAQDIVVIIIIIIIIMFVYYWPVYT